MYAPCARIPGSAAACRSGESPTRAGARSLRVARADPLAGNGPSGRLLAADRAPAEQRADQRDDRACTGEEGNPGRGVGLVGGAGPCEEREEAHDAEAAAEE